MVNFICILYTRVKFSNCSDFDENSLKWFLLMKMVANCHIETTNIIVCYVRSFAAVSWLYQYIVQGWPWPPISSRPLHRRCGKLIFYDSLHQKAGTIWDHFHQNRSILKMWPLYKGLEKCIDLWPILTHISQTKHLMNFPLWTFMFLMS